MSEHNQYHTVHASTLDAMKRYRELLEEALTNHVLPPKVRAELEAELALALKREEEEEKKEKQSEGGTSSGSKGSGEGGGGYEHGEGRGNEDSLNNRDDLESLALLFYTAEHDVGGGGYTLERSVISHILQRASGVATLLVSRRKQTAHINSSVRVTPQAKSAPPAAFLPGIEQQALKAGAKYISLHAPSEDVAHLKDNHGYEPHGPAFDKDGMTLQKMHKTLMPNKTPGTDPT